MTGSAGSTSGMARERRYKLARGTQVREEDFGLLFYTMNGPKLFFLTCGRLLEAGFFEGKVSLSQWNQERLVPDRAGVTIQYRLAQLAEKGVLVEC